jgi:hypothetical protein
LRDGGPFVRHGKPRINAESSTYKTSTGLGSPSRRGRRFGVGRLYGWPVTAFSGLASPGGPTPPRSRDVALSGPIALAATSLPVPSTQTRLRAPSEV